MEFCSPLQSWKCDFPAARLRKSRYASTANYSRRLGPTQAKYNRHGKRETPFLPRHPSKTSLSLFSRAARIASWREAGNSVRRRMTTCAEVEGRAGAPMLQAGQNHHQKNGQHARQLDLFQEGDQGTQHKRKR